MASDDGGGAAWMQEAETTGASLVLLPEVGVGSGASVAAELAAVSGLAASSVALADFGDGDEALDAPVVLFEDLGVAVVDGDADTHSRLVAASGQSVTVLAVEPERVVHVLDESTAVSPDFLQGYLSGVEQLVGEVLSTRSSTRQADASATAWDETTATWGLQATRSLESCLTGRGVRVAILDTGMFFAHPDFADRRVTGRSFVVGETAEDGHGHGTHCIGTACGSAKPIQQARYGVATEAEIYAGKVLSNKGSGADRGILNGIQWAVQSGCRVVSMSLGAPVGVGARPSAVFEEVARRAAVRGTVIVAAAGNDSNRPALLTPVSHPANCPSILAVAALGPALDVASFSNEGINPEGGRVDIAAPGVDVLSSWLAPARYRRLRGTSMATPHVAGVLALLAQSDPDATAAQLKDQLQKLARRMPVPSTSVGAGFVQAP